MGVVPALLQKPSDHPALADAQPISARGVGRLGSPPRSRSVLEVSVALVRRCARRPPDGSVFAGSVASRFGVLRIARAIIYMYLENIFGIFCVSVSC
jgi:hypothetical protein